MEHKPHTVSVFDQELDKLQKTVLKMISVAAEQLEGARVALLQRDEVLARKIVDRDHEVNALQEAVDNCTLRLLALRQPLAVDLRQILTAARMAADLERIADYAAAVAKRMPQARTETLDRMVEAISSMAIIAKEMLEDAGKAYLQADEELAKQVWKRDDEIDHIYSQSLKSLAEYMINEPECGEPCISLLNAARAVERVGDHITNLAEHTMFLVSGNPHITE